LRAQRQHLHPRQAPAPEPPVFHRTGRPPRRQVLYCTTLLCYYYCHQEWLGV
jgi:hypothetical protein